MKSEKFVTSFLDQNSFIMVNERIIKMLDGDSTTAIILSKFISLHKYFMDTDFNFDGWFYQKVQDIEDRVGINDYHQRKSISILEAKGFLTSKLRGTPPRRYFKLSFDKIEKSIFFDKVTSRKFNQDKKGFYQAFNSCASWDDLDAVRHNIPRPIAEVMYCYMVTLNEGFGGWNPQNYGLLSSYLKKAYLIPERQFNYRTLFSWYFENPNGHSKTVKSFIEFDSTGLELLGPFMTSEVYLKRIGKEK